MRSRRALLALALAALAGAIAVVAALVAVQRQAAGDVPGGVGEQGVEVRGDLVPRLTMFGDTVRAIVDVTLDRSRLDPESVRVTAEFSPWQVVGRPERDRTDAGSTTLVRTTFVLRCTTSVCLPTGQASARELDAGRVTVAPADPSAGRRRSIAVDWPLLVQYSRFAGLRFDDRETAATPWRADVRSLPAVSYRVAPGLLLALLLTASAVLAAAGVALGVVAWPRRAPVPPPEPEPEPEPGPSLTPLERALALLEDSVRIDGAGEQRRALELVAEELEEWGDLDLAGSARVLAWSEGMPGVEETSTLAARVRFELEQTLLERAAPEPSGDDDVA